MLRLVERTAVALECKLKLGAQRMVSPTNSALCPRLKPELQRHSIASEQTMLELWFDAAHACGHVSLAETHS